MLRHKKFTKLLLSSAALSTLIACSSDTEIPDVSASSPYSCNSYNDAELSGDKRMLEGMQSDMRKIFRSEYQGGSTIERFYQNHIDKELSYAVPFLIAFESECLRQSDLGILEAGQLAINNVWNEMKGQTEYAMCWSLNNSLFDSKTLVSQQGKKARIGSVLDYSDYGQSYVEDKVAEYCAKNPNVRASAALSESVKAETQILADARQAELDKAAEERAQKRQQEKLAENIKKYGGSVTGEDRPRFTTLEKQLELAEKGQDNHDKFLAGLKLSILDVAAQLPDYKRKAIEPLGDDLAYEVARFMVDGCRACEGGYLGNLKHFPKVKDAQSDVVIGIQVMLDGYAEAAAACVAGQTCEAKTQKKAADMALSDAKTCDAYRENGMKLTSTKCFEDAQPFYDYWYSILVQNTKG